MKTLEIRDRNIPGTDTPLSAEVCFLIPGETIEILIPFGQVLPAGMTIVVVDWVTKTGHGASLSGLAIAGNGTDVVGMLSLAATAGQSQLIAVRAQLSTAEVWEINVPCERLDHT